MNFGGNIAVYLTEVVLMDSKFESMQDDTVAKVRSLTNKPIRYVILTPNHPDHAGGAAKLAADGAPVIISECDRENLARAPNGSWVPQIGYFSRADIALGGNMSNCARSGATQVAIRLFISRLSASLAAGISSPLRPNCRSL
jgi:glyoxylase-like metal-dependent hydrolase (beta-lactamase superfamily II)